MTHGTRRLTPDATGLLETGLGIEAEGIGGAVSLVTQELGILAAGDFAVPW